MANKFDNVKVNKIRTAREELMSVASRLRKQGRVADADEITEIVSGLMFRTRSKSTLARATAKRITKDKVLEVLSLLRAHPSKSNRWIGRQSGIDGGRVSEIIAGLRTPSSPTINSNVIRNDD